MFRYSTTSVNSPCWFIWHRPRLTPPCLDSVLLIG
ncbi:AgrD family cyclic lactone autoinducer peptide [Pseudoalteromonas mariniglutinosa]